MSYAASLNHSQTKEELVSYLNTPARIRRNQGAPSFPVHRGDYVQKAPRQTKHFSCWVDKVGGMDMEHSNAEADRGLCTRCFPVLKKSCNKFKVPRLRTIIVPLQARLEKEPNQKDFWYTYRYNGKSIVARDVSVGKNSPLKIYFVRDPYNVPPQTPMDPQNPISDMWFSYKFGIHDFALYKWKGKGFNIDSKINKVELRPEAQQEIKSRAMQPGSGVVYVYQDADFIYYQDLRGVLARILSKKGGSRKRKAPMTAATTNIRKPDSLDYGHVPNVNMNQQQIIQGHVQQAHMNPSINTTSGHEHMIPISHSMTQSMPPLDDDLKRNDIYEHDPVQNGDGQPLVGKEFSQDIFTVISPMPSSEFGDLDGGSRILHDEFFQPNTGMQMSTEPLFAPRSLRSNTIERDDLAGVRNIDGVKSVNNCLEGKFFRRGSNIQTVLDTNLSSFYTEKFCGPWGFFTVFSDYKNPNFSIYRYGGPTCTPLALDLQKERGITICAIWHSKFWTTIRNNSKKDGEKAINLFVDAHNTRILHGDILVCKVARPTKDRFESIIELEGKGGVRRQLTLVKRAQPHTDLHQLLRHLVLRILACLQVVQIPKEYNGKTLKEIGLQNDGLTVWSTIKKSGGESIESYVDANTRLEKGVYIVVKKSRADANLEEKCQMFSRGELGWIDDDAEEVLL